LLQTFYIEREGGEREEGKKKVRERKRDVSISILMGLKLHTVIQPVFI